uniref:flagellar hook-length control protein FliK n=1 Tax=Tepidiforma sp. TaxID=2682230 RepID=UPI002ADDEC1D
GAPAQRLPAAPPVETLPAAPSNSGAPAPLAAQPPGDQPPNPAEPTTVTPPNNTRADAPAPPTTTQTEPILPPAAGAATDAHPGQPTQSVAAPQPTEPDNPAAPGQPAQTGAPPLPADIAEQPSPQGVVRPVGNAKAEPETQQRPVPATQEHRPLPRAAEPAIQHAAPNSAVAQLRESAPAPSASAPQPTPPAPEPAPQAIQNLDALATTVIERVESGGGEARIHLEPAGLGEITIHLHARHDAVHLDVHAETPEAVQLLRDAATDLSSLLGQRGLNLAGLDIGLGSRSGGGGSPWASDTAPRPQAAPGQFAALLGIDDPAALAREQRLRAAYNPDGSLLYRI